MPKKDAASVIHKKKDSNALSENILALYREMNEYILLMHQKNSSDSIPLADIDWKKAVLPADIKTFLQSEFTFQPEEVELKIQFRRREGIDANIKLAIERGGSQWSSIDLATWDNGSPGIMVGTGNFGGAGRIRRARESASKIEARLYLPDTYQKYKARLADGQQIFQFIVKETVRAVSQTGFVRT